MIDQYWPPYEHQRSFDDEGSASLFKLALILGFCCGEIPADEVQQIFDETPNLRSA
jgi:hypothetical protein